MQVAADHRGTLTLGEWQEFSLYLDVPVLPIAMFGMIIHTIRTAAASAKRIFEILDATKLRLPINRRRSHASSARAGALREGQL